MKYFLLMSLPFVLLLSACGGRAYNCNSYPRLPVVFSGFDIQEVDTILITGYKKEEPSFSTITEPEYSHVSEHFNNFPNHEPTLTIHVDTDHDWDIYLPATNTHYYISEYIISVQKCPENGSGPKSRLISLGGYTLNGQPMMGRECKIDKGF